MYDAYSAGYVIALGIGYVVMTQLFTWLWPTPRRRRART